MVSLSKIQSFILSIPSKIALIPSKIQEEYKKIIRILKVSTKPSFNDFLFILKICTLGVILIGAIGIIISAIFSIIDSL
jgi:protein translocase SEC61 complex gamma subunit